MAFALATIILTACAPARLRAQGVPVLSVRATPAWWDIGASWAFRNTGDRP
jgi:hypothetical protein